MRRWRRLFEASVVLGVTSAAWSCSSSEAPFEPLEAALEWDEIVIGTGNPTICDEYFADDTDTCILMAAWKAWQIELTFNVPNFRSDFNCVLMELTLEDVLSDYETRASGTHSYNAGVSAFGFVPYAVWFNDALYSKPAAEKQRVIGHEAYHLAFLDVNHVTADQAANYCFGYSSNPPW